MCGWKRDWEWGEGLSMCGFVLNWFRIIETFDICPFHEIDALLVVENHVPVTWYKYTTERYVCIIF
jgi:hypothetical protein